MSEGLWVSRSRGHKCPAPWTAVEVSLSMLLLSVPPHLHQQIQNRETTTTFLKSFIIEFISIHINELEHEPTRIYKFRPSGLIFFFTVRCTLPAPINPALLTQLKFLGCMWHFPEVQPLCRTSGASGPDKVSWRASKAGLSWETSSASWFQLSWQRTK